MLLLAGRLGEVQEDLFEERNETNDQLKKPMKEGEHEVGLQESSQKLSDDCIQRFSGVKFPRDGVWSHLFESDSLRVRKHEGYFILSVSRTNNLGTN